MVKVIPKKVISKHSKLFFNAHLKALQTNIRKLRKIYHGKSDPHNWSILQEAINDYSKAYHQAKQAWWISFCNKINCDDKKFWKSIDKVLNGDAKCVIQPLIKADGTYEFDDKEISKTLIDTHVKRTTSSTADFDEDFYIKINESITNSIETEKHSNPVSQTTLNHTMSTSVVLMLKPHFVPSRANSHLAQITYFPKCFLKQKTFFLSLQVSFSSCAGEKMKTLIFGIETTKSSFLNRVNHIITQPNPIVSSA